MATRPATVTLSVYLLWLAAAMQFVDGVAALATYEDTKHGYQNAYAGTDMASQVHTLTLSIVSGAVLSLLLAAMLAALGGLTGRGNRVGRILVWTLGGMTLCCGVFGLSFGAFSKGVYDSSRGTNPNLPSAGRVRDALNAAQPGWYGPLTTTAAIIGILAIVLAIILLALPASNPYFRRAEQEWAPPEHIQPEPHAPTYAPPEHEVDAPPAAGDHVDPPPAAL